MKQVIKGFIHYTFFYMKLIHKKLVWDSQIAKKLSVLKPQRLRNL